MRIPSLCAAAMAAAMLGIAAHAGPLDGFSEAGASTGLRDALDQSAREAVRALGRNDGFLGNAEVRIPLPPSLEKARGALKMVGMQRQADELVTAMNRAAEDAVPAAAEMLVEAVRQMSVADAKAILTGGDDAATRYFREKTAEGLAQKFLPVVKSATERVGLAEKYNALAGQGRSLGLVKDQDATIEGYVTRKALDGLYHVIAVQEKALRRNPMAAGSDAARRIFGALR